MSGVTCVLTGYGIVNKFGGKITLMVFKNCKPNYSILLKHFITDIKSLEIIVKIGLNGSFVKWIQN